MRGSTDGFLKKRFFSYFREVLRRFAVMLGVTIIITGSISVTSEISRNCFLGSNRANFAGKLVKTGKSKLTLVEFYIPAFCYGKNVGVESLYCGGKIDFVYGYVDPISNYCKAQRPFVIQDLASNRVRNDDWRINKFYNYDLPPAWNPSIPIAYRRLVI